MFPMAADVNTLRLIDENARKAAEKDFKEGENRSYSWFIGREAYNDRWNELENS